MLRRTSPSRGFLPMTPQEMRALRDRCAPLAADGHLELYQSTRKYRAAVSREQHGFPPQSKLPI